MTKCLVNYCEGWFSPLKSGNVPDVTGFQYYSIVSSSSSSDRCSQLVYFDIYMRFSATLGTSFFGVLRHEIGG